METLLGRNDYYLIRSSYATKSGTSINEEANELCQTLEDNEDESRTASEMADLVYHAMVLLAVKDVKVEEALEVLRKRFSQSGIEEKKSPKSDNQAHQ